MGFRPGQAKAPYVGAPGGIIPPGTITTLISRWINFPILATDFTAAGNTESITIWTMPAGTKIQNALLVPEMIFSGVGLNTYKIKIGIAAHLNRYMNLFDVKTAPGPGNFGFTFGPWLESIGMGTAILATAMDTGTNLNNVILGRARLYLEVSNIFGTPLP